MSALPKISGSKLKSLAYAALFGQAHAAGVAAADAKVPAPMVVAQHVNPLDDSSPVVKAWYVPSGVCGFAWVNIKPANSGFAKYMLASGMAHKSAYEGGVSYWIHAYGQSYEKKVAYAYAFAAELQKSGIKAYAGDRLD